MQTQTAVQIAVTRLTEFLIKVRDEHAEIFLNSSLDVVNKTLSEFGINLFHGLSSSEINELSLYYTRCHEQATSKFSAFTEKKPTTFCALLNSALMENIGNTSGASSSGSSIQIEGSSSSSSSSGEAPLITAYRRLISVIENWPGEGSGDPLELPLEALDEMANTLGIGRFLSILDGGQQKKLAGMVKRFLSNAHKSVSSSSSSSSHSVRNKFVDLMREELTRERERVEKQSSEGSIIKVRAPKKAPFDIALYHAAFDRLCLYDAIYDLLSGKLHRLDPIIGDFGCQWRVPFVIDLHNDAFDFIVNFVCTNHLSLDISRLEDPAIMRDAVGLLGEFLQEYNNMRYYTGQLEEFVSVSSYGALLSSFQGCSGKRGLIEVEIERLTGRIMAFCDQIFRASPYFRAIVERLTPWLETYKMDLIPRFNAKTYLTCCKILTQNRIRSMDCFGLSGIQTTRDIPLPPRSIQVKIAQLAECSYSYMKYVARTVCTSQGVVFGSDAITFDGPEPMCLPVHRLLENHPFWTFQQDTRYQSHCFYGPFRLLMGYQLVKNQPIIIDIKRLICTPGSSEDDATYTFNGGAILYYAPHRESGSFRFVADPTPEQMDDVGMCVEVFSVLNTARVPECREEERGLFSPDFQVFLETLTTRCSITDLILMASASHDELPTNICTRDSSAKIPEETLKGILDEAIRSSITVLPNLDDVSPVYCTSLVGTGVPLLDLPSTRWNITTERGRLLLLLERFGLTSTEYKIYERGRVTALRIMSTVPFAPIHIYGCTYAIKMREFKALIKSRRTEIVARRRVTRDDCLDKID